MTDLVQPPPALDEVAIRTALGPTYADFSQIVSPSDSNDEVYAKLEVAADYILHIHDASRWWIADHLLFSEAVVGQEAAQLAERFHLSPGTLTRYRRVAERVPRSRRRKTLTFSHHKAVASMEPDDQTYWLDRAEQESLSRDDLEREIIKRKDSGDSGPAGPQVVDPDIIPSRVVEVAKQISRNARRTTDYLVDDWIVSDELMVQLRAALGEE